MKLTQDLDLNLYCLYQNLLLLQQQNYDYKIERKLQDFINYIDSILFKPLKSGYDIIDTKCTYTVYLEKFNIK